MGVNVYRYRLVSFVVACAIAGLLGSFYAHYQTFIIPTAFNLFPKTIYIQVFAVLGGVGYATLGPIVGAAALSLFNEVFSGYEEWAIIIVGALVLVVVVFLPKGLLSLGEVPGRIRVWRQVRRVKRETDAMGIEPDPLLLEPDALVAELELPPPVRTQPGGES
jgi:branched-chain amino acid transport system permease protein